MYGNSEMQSFSEVSGGAGGGAGAAGAARGGHANCPHSNRSLSYPIEGGLKKSLQPALQRAVAALADDDDDKGEDTRT
ncbi:unnamed protein product, partial [Brenthis ino]